MMTSSNEPPRNRCRARVRPTACSTTPLSRLKGPQRPATPIPVEVDTTRESDSRRSRFFSRGVKQPEGSLPGPHAMYNKSRQSAAVSAPVLPGAETEPCLAPRPCESCDSPHRLGTPTSVSEKTDSLRTPDRCDLRCPLRLAHPLDTMLKAL